MVNSEPFKDGVELLIPLLPDFEKVKPPPRHDHEICICGDVECTGICDTVMYSVHQLIYTLGCAPDELQYVKEFLNG